MKAGKSRATKRMRALAWVTALAYLWVFLCANPVQAWAQQAARKNPPKPTPPKPYVNPLHIPSPVALPAHWRPNARHKRPALSLLAENARLGGRVTLRQINAWKRLLTAPHTPRAQAARLHVWLGEWQLAQNRQPQNALAHFQRAQQLAPRTDPVSGLAAYDRALALYEEGQFALSEQAFRHLLTTRHFHGGYDWKTCALWRRHASACAGYHAAHARLGIPEPPRLDPLCGAAGLATCLRGRGLAFDEAHVLSVCRRNGLGSSAQDILDACKKLGVVGRLVRASHKGLVALPKPLVAYVEHDHFIAVTKTDKTGVDYLCSDCGAWPGGRVHLSWKQWKALDASLFLTVTRPQTDSERWLAAVLAPSHHKNLTSKAPPSKASSSPWTLSDLGLKEPDPAQMHDEIVLFGGGGGQVTCGGKNDPYRCTYFQVCPYPPCKDGGNGADGPSQGDPVNLATGEEEYRPPADLTVYNPIGPSVVWGRIYNSLRSPAQSGGVLINMFYNADDFGVGWSHPYNVGVYDPSLAFNGVQGSDLYAKPGQVTTLAPTGNDAPAAGLLADIVQNGVTVATSAHPNGWAFGYSANNGGSLYVWPPSNAYGTGYELRVQQQNAAYSAFFDAGYLPVAQAGTKYVYFPNGATVAINAPHVPVNPSGNVYNPASDVSCSVQPGANFLVDWIADGSAAGHYVITFPDRSQWITTNSPVTNGSAFGGGLVYYLYQQTDRNGHSLHFNYSGLGPSGLPLLSSITNDANTQLLTFNRIPAGLTQGSLASVTDCYQRQVAYHVGYYNNQGVPSTALQGYPELDFVSVVTGIGPSGPGQCLYGYTLTGNGENSEQVISLQTITTPSPTGVGVSTASLSYNDTGEVTSVTDGNGNYDVYGYSANSSSTSITTFNAQSQQVYHYTVGFDNNMNHTTSTDGAGHTVFDAVYNEDYQPISITDGIGNETDYSWDGFSNVLSVLSPRGTLTSYVYYDPYDTTNPDAPLSNDPNVIPLKDIASVQEGSKAPISFTYDALGHIASLTGPSPGSANNSGAVQTNITYDTLGNPLTASSYSFAGGQPVSGSGTPIRSAVFNYTIDGSFTQNEALGEPLSITVVPVSGSSHTAHLRYFPRGTVQSVIDALGNESDMSYNLADQPLQTLYPATGQTGTGRASSLNAYLYVGGPQIGVAAYDENNNQVRSVFTNYGQEGETLSISGSAEPVTCRYDALYRCISLADGNNNATTCSYSQAGYPSVVTYPNGDTVQYSQYDNAGNLLQSIDGNGVQITYVHTRTQQEPEGLLSAINYPQGLSQYNIALQRDALYGRVISKTDNAGSYAYAYDDRDAITSTQTIYTGLPAWTTAYNYNPDGTLGSLQLSGTSNLTFSYSYDGFGRMTGVTSPSSDQFNFGYLDNDWLYQQSSQASSSNGLLPICSSTSTLNAQGQLIELTNNSANDSVLSDFSGSPTAFNPTVNTLHYDGVGNLLSKVSTIANALGFSGTTNYSYDFKDQLLQAGFSPGQGNNGYQQSFAYDSAGNSTTFKGVTQTFNAANQNTANSYDGNGNPTTYKGVNLTFDVQNNLTQVPGEMTAGYTSAGLRAWKQSANASAPTYFLYDSAAMPICELDSSGNVTATNTFGPNGLVSRHTQSGSLFYAFDPHGNVAQRLDANGNVVSAHLFDAFGVGQAVDYSNGTVPPDPFTSFGGQWGYYSDWETGLQRLGFRYYDVSAGRFLNRDPMGYAGGINLYAYVCNQPLNFMDPLGLCFACDVSNFFAGWGDLASFGLTKIARKYIGGWLGIGDSNCQVSYRSGLYTIGEVVGIVYGMALTGAASLSAGAESVFYSGEGAADIARASKGAGKLLEDTLGGKILNATESIAKAHIKDYRGFGKGWKVFSAIFAMNARGTATCFARNPSLNSVWMTTEKPILEFLGTIIIYR